MLCWIRLPYRIGGGVSWSVRPSVRVYIVIDIIQPGRRPILPSCHRVWDKQVAAAASVPLDRARTTARRLLLLLRLSQPDRSHASARSRDGMLSRLIIAGGVFRGAAAACCRRLQLPSGGASSCALRRLVLAFAAAAADDATPGGRDSPPTPCLHPGAKPPCRRRRRLRRRRSSTPTWC